MKRLVPVLFAALLSVGASAPHGGWAAITVEDLPDFIVAGTPIDLAFTIRQHGVELIDGLEPRVEARAAGKMRASVDAKAAGRGRYLARVTVPEAGAWTVTIRSGFGPSDVDLLPIRGIAAGGKPVPLSLEQRGRALFVAKGCVSCHAHADVPGSGRFAVGPPLTGTTLPADYIASFIAEPSIRPVRTDGLRMPDLDLRPAEIAALVAFLRPEPLPHR